MVWLDNALKRINDFILMNQKVHTQCHEMDAVDCSTYAAVTARVMVTVTARVMVQDIHHNHIEHALKRVQKSLMRINLSLSYSFCCARYDLNAINRAIRLIERL